MRADGFTLRFRNLVIRGAAASYVGRLELRDRGTRIYLETDTRSTAVFIAVGSVLIASAVLILNQIGAGIRMAGLAAALAIGVGGVAALVAHSAANEEIRALRRDLATALQKEEQATGPST